MQEVVAQKKPSENEIRGARTFLMRILRNSMRYSLGFTINLLLWYNKFVCFML